MLATLLCTTVHILRCEPFHGVGKTGFLTQLNVISCCYIPLLCSDQDCGYFYPKEDAATAIDQLHLAITTFDDNMELHYNRSAHCVFRHHTTNPDNILGWCSYTAFCIYWTDALSRPLEWERRLDELFAAPRSTIQAEKLQGYAATLHETPLPSAESSTVTLPTPAEEAETAATATAYSAAAPKESKPTPIHRDESMGRGQAGATSAATSTAAKVEPLHSGELPEEVKTAHKQEHVRQEYKEQLIDMLADFD